MIHKKNSLKITLRKGALEGYSIKNKQADRRKVLDVYATKSGWGEVVKRLNVLGIYNKNRYPEYTKKYRRDMAYIQKKFDPKRSVKRSVKKPLKAKRSVKRSVKKPLKAKRSVKRSVKKPLKAKRSVKRSDW
jgi:hypothetical protein